jgi:hypothetical protein
LISRFLDARTLLGVEADGTAREEIRMSGELVVEPTASAVARFPNVESLEGFLHQVRLWNRVEGLPQVAASPSDDRARVQVRTAASAYRGITRLIEAFGGLVVETTRP